MLGSEQLQLIYEAAEDCVAAGRYTNAAKLLRAFWSRTPIRTMPGSPSCWMP